MKKTYKKGEQTGKIVPFIQTGEYYFNKGLLSYRKRDLYKAKKYLTRAVHLEPSDPMIICQLAVVLSELADYTLSNKLLHSVVDEHDPDMTECFYFLANNYAHLGLFQEANKYANYYLELDEDGDFAEDTEDLLDLLSIEMDEDADDYEVEDELIVKQENARALLEEGKLEEATLLLQEIIQEYPEFWSAHNNLALAYFYTGNVKSATQIVEDVLEKNPGNLHALCNALVFLYYQRKTKKVKDLTQKLEQVHPLLIEHRYKLGATFGLIGRYDLSFKWLRHLQKQGFEGDDTFYYWLSYASYFTGNTALAEATWKKVVEMNPQKAGSEPWLLQGEKPVKNAHVRWLQGEYIEERLFGIYLEGKTKTSSSIKDLNQVTLHSTLEKEFADYSLARNKHQLKNTTPAYIQDGYEIIDLLFEKNQPSDSGLYLTWFLIFDEAIHRSSKLHNIPAWAAATEYIWLTAQSKKVTQKELAHKYSISYTTIAKYIKVVKLMLE
ncbi:tetratricopeptide repeat protein [Bacillus timonensis]|nr:tetratricopeptide repeat protein [Bacillus timonensis]